MPLKQVISNKGLSDQRVQVSNRLVPRHDRCFFFASPKKIERAVLFPQPIARMDEGETSVVSAWRMHREVQFGRVAGSNEEFKACAFITSSDVEVEFLATRKDIGVFSLNISRIGSFSTPSHGPSTRTGLGMSA